MNQYDDSNYFDDTRLMEQFKQTATFFNQNQSQVKNPMVVKTKPPMEYTFKPGFKELQNSLPKRAVQVQQKVIKINSPVKLTKYVSPKPFSQAEPLTKYQQQIKRIKEPDIKDEIQHQYLSESFRPIQQVKVVRKTQQQEVIHEVVRLSSDQTEYPSYKKSLLESDRFNTRQNLNDLLKKSNSTAFLPQIRFNQKNTISHQETDMRTISSKQNISSNEFLGLQPDDSLMRKSKTAQETLREQQFQPKIPTKLNSAESSEMLPKIHSPNTQSGFSQSKGRSFLQRKPQAKIISRLFSSKSDNKNN